MSPSSRITGIAVSLSLALVVLTACASPIIATPGSSLARDILEIKDKLDKNIEQQNKATSKQDYMYNSMNENLTAQKDTMQNTLDDLTKQMRTQADELQKLRNQVQELTFLIKPGAPGTNPGTAPLGQTPAPAAAGATPPPGPNAPAQAIASAQNSLNAGQYEQAREGFRQALELNPTMDQKIEAYFGLAEACNKSNDTASAVDNYTKVIYTDPKHPKAWVSLERIADIRIKEGDNKMALKLLESIVNNYPQYPNIDQVKATIAKLKGSGQ